MAKQSKFKIFLDIDGVLNSNDWFVRLVEKGSKSPKLKRADFKTDRFFPLHRALRLDPEAIKCANMIRSATGAEWVVSSTWRHGSPDEFDDLVVYLACCGLEGEVVGRTNTTPRASRGVQIQIYLDDHKLRPEQCLILDDDSDMLHLSSRHIKTNYLHGLTPSDVKRALQLVGR